MDLMNCLIEVHEDRQSWLSARQSMIGASDTAAIMGVGYTNQSPLTVWQSKISDVTPTLSPALEKRLRIGKLMEPTLAAIFQSETGLQVDDPGEFTIFRSEQHPWLGATLDRIAEHDEWGIVPVEMKNIDAFNRSEWDDDRVPLKYEIQCQHQMAVTGSSHAFLFALAGGNDPLIRVIERHERFISEMISKLMEFHGYVMRNEIPPVDASEATARALAEIYPDDHGETIDLPVEATSWAMQLDQARLSVKMAKERQLEVENKIKAALGDAMAGNIPGGGKFTWKLQERKGYVVEDSKFRVLRKTK